MLAILSGLLATLSGGADAPPRVNCRIAERSAVKTAVAPRELCAAFKQALANTTASRVWDIELTLKRPGILTARGTWRERGAKARTLDPVSVAVSDAPIGQTEAVALAQAVAASIKVHV